MRKLLWALCIAVLAPTAVGAATIGQDDFDGNTLGLIGSTIPALDGGAGDYFGLGSRNDWPQGFPSPGVPFSLADDSVFGYSNDGSPFPTDNEGVFGVNSDLDNVYFALSDTREWTAPQLEATWTFDITGAENLALEIDMGGISNASSGGFSLDTDVKIVASIDAGPEQTLIDIDAIDNPGFVTRPMDVGIASGGGRLLTAVGAQKFLAEDGTLAGNTYLDKTPPSGPGQGLMDTFRAPIVGSGSTLVVTLRANVPFEAMALDNLVIDGDVITPTQKSTWGSLKARYR